MLLTEGLAMGMPRAPDGAREDSIAPLAQAAGRGPGANRGISAICS